MEVAPVKQRNTSAIDGRLSPDQRELRQIRLDLRLTKSKFSSDLSIPLCTLDSYEYGKTNSVPPAVMHAARMLQANSSTQGISAQIERFALLSMREILGLWASNLKIDVSDTTRLAEALSVTTTTIRRWRENKVRPNPAKIAEINTKVNGPGAVNIDIALRAIENFRVEIGPTGAGASETAFVLTQRAQSTLSLVAAKAPSPAGSPIDQGIVALNRMVDAAPKVESGGDNFSIMNAPALLDALGFLIAALKAAKAAQPGA